MLAIVRELSIICCLSGQTHRKIETNPLLGNIITVFINVVFYFSMTNNENMTMIGQYTILLIMEVLIKRLASIQTEWET